MNRSTSADPQGIRARLAEKGWDGALLSEAEFQQQSMTMQPHDKLFIYSDGGEALVGQSGEDFRFQFSKRFREICRLPIEEMLSAYNEMAENYRFSPGETDDVTAIGLEIL